MEVAMVSAFGELPVWWESCTEADKREWSSPLFIDAKEAKKADQIKMPCRLH